MCRFYRQDNPHHDADIDWSPNSFTINWCPTTCSTDVDTFAGTSRPIGRGQRPQLLLTSQASPREQQTDSHQQDVQDQTHDEQCEAADVSC